jgi:hypothetical protein
MGPGTGTEVVGEIYRGSQRKFVKAICIGNMSNAEAYRSAYGTEMSVSVASAAANRLLKRRAVAGYRRACQTQPQ